MFHIAGGVFLGIVAADWFLSFLEKRMVAKMHKRAEELLRTAPQRIDPIEMYFADPEPVPMAPKEPFSFHRLRPLWVTAPYFVGMAALYFLFRP